MPNPTATVTADPVADDLAASAVQAAGAGPAERPLAESLLASARAAVAQMAGVDWASVDRRDLVAVLVGVEQLRSVLDAVTVDLVGRIDATQAAPTQGWASAADLVTAVAGGEKGAGPGLVRLARRLTDLPATRAGLAEGWLSRAKASVVAGLVASLPHDAGLRSAAEEILLDSARSMDAGDLRASWPRVLERLDPDGTRLGDDSSLERRERDAHARRHLSISPDRHGGVRWSGHSDIETAELVKATLMPLTAPQPSPPGSCGGIPPERVVPGTSFREQRGDCPDTGCAHDGRDRRDGGARLMDALVIVCREAQGRAARHEPGGGGVPADHGAPPRMFITVPLAAIRAGFARAQAGMPLWQPRTSQVNQADPATDPATEAAIGDVDPDWAAGLRIGGLVNGLPLSVAAVRRLACDAEILPAVLGAHGQILDLGRSQRLVSTGLWHALVLRDGRCAFPGCGRLPLACDAHHIVHWADGGPTDLGNLVMTCRRHHTLLHTTPWQVRVSPVDGRPEFRPPPRRDQPGDQQSDRWVRQRDPRDLLADTG